MKEDVMFSGNSQAFDMAFDQGNQTFSVNMGNTQPIGKNGATFTPHVSEDGVLSWTNDRGLPNPEPVNIRGKDGVDGKTPVKGTDYFTEADKAEMVVAVIAALPKYNGEVIPL